MAMYTHFCTSNDLHTITTLTTTEAFCFNLSIGKSLVVKRNYFQVNAVKLMQSYLTNIAYIITYIWRLSINFATEWFQLSKKSVVQQISQEID